MQPFSNPRPPRFQNNAPNPSFSQQGFTPSSQMNNQNNNLLMQQQMGLINPQIAPIPNSLMMQPGFPPAQLGAPQVGFTAQLGHQQGAYNVNVAAAAAQLCNLLQSQGNQSQPQMQLVHTLANLAAQNMNMNPFMGMQPQMLMHMQMPNPAHVGPQGFVPGSQQAMACPNPAFFVGPQFGQQQVNRNMPPNVTIANGSNPLQNVSKQDQGQTGTVPPPQGQNIRPNGGQRPQGKHMKNFQANTSNSSWKNSPSKKFNNNRQREASKSGFQKSHGDNVKRKWPHKKHRDQGYGNERGAEYGWTNSAEQPKEKKRSLALSYTDEEIQKWCEERKRNYPSASNIKKKLDAKTSASTTEAQMRRQQLKEILAKQAELGVEVAEIPSYYLSDKGTREQQTEDNQQPMDRKSRFHGRGGGKRKYDKNNRFSKKQRQEGRETCNVSSCNKKQPSLLEKLLSADIRRDKKRLLQAFRFMVMNSFFKDWPDKPLEFPLVVVKENGRNDVLVEEKHTQVQLEAASDQLENDNGDANGKDDSEGSDNHNDDGSESIDHKVNNTTMDEIQGEKEVDFVAGKGNSQEKAAELSEEEGEIID